MVLLTMTPQILEAISRLPQDALNSLPETDLPTTPGSPISHLTLLTISRLAKTYITESHQQCSLSSLLRGAYPYHPPPAPLPTKSPEYLALMSRLRAEQEARDYRVLVAKQKLDSTDDEVTGEKDDINPSLVFNILLSVIMCGAAVFVMTRYWRSDGLRVLVSMGTGVVVGCAEVGVYAIFLRKKRLGKEKEALKKEKQFLLNSEEISALRSSESVAGSTKIEKEEIWGRGKHGGMRRRVREKWEKEQEQEPNKVS